MALRKIKPEIRFLNEVKKVLSDQKWAKTAKNFGVYFIYRGIKKKDGLRCDLIIIPSRMLGEEFPKTVGHEHLGNLPEIYQVLQGRAIFLIQKSRNQKVEDVYAVLSKKGEVVIIPKKYGHLTINPGKEKLKVINFISEKCQNIYDLFIKKRGACYYYIKKGWIKNKNYLKIPKLAFKKPLKKMPKNLDFLKR